MRRPRPVRPLAALLCGLSITVLASCQGEQNEPSPPTSTETTQTSPNPSVTENEVPVPKSTPQVAETPTTDEPPTEQPETDEPATADPEVTAKPEEEPLGEPSELPVVEVDPSTLTGAGFSRRWEIAGEEPVYAESVEIGDDFVVINRRGSERRVAFDELGKKDQWLVTYWRDTSRRRALQKFSEIGSVGFDEQGGIELGLSQSGCTDNDLALAAALPETTAVYLFETPVSDDGLKVFTQLPELRFLHLEETDVKGPGFAHLAGLSKLEDFKYSPDPGPGHAPSFAEHLQHLGSLQSLKKLGLWFCELDEGSLAPVGKLANLEELELMGTEYPEGELKHLAGLTKLRLLDLGDGTFGDDDMQYLAGMTELRSLDLGGGDLSKAGLERVARFEKLEKLMLSRLEDEDVAVLAGLTGLRQLRLWGDDLTDACLVHVAGMTEMRDLQLPEQTTAKGLEHLAGMKQLERLHFTGENVTMSEALQLVVDRQGRTVTEALQIILRPDIVDDDGNVTWLSLDYRPVPDEATLKYLRGLPELKGLALGKQTTDAWLAQIGPLPKLKSIQFRGSRFDDMPIRLSAEGLAHLKGCPALTNVEFSDTDLAAGALAPLAELPALESISIRDCKLAEGNLQALGRLGTLESLYLQNVPMSDDDVKPLAGLSKLKYVSLPRSVTLAGLAHLKSIETLERMQMNWAAAEFSDILNLLEKDFGRTRAEALKLFASVSGRADGTAVGFRWPYDMPASDADLAVVLDTFPDLVRLSVPAGITKAGLERIGERTTLVSLNVDGPGVDDEGLAALTGLESLEELSVESENVTDAGLVHLAKLKALKSVYLYNTSVTDAGVARLQQALPDASIRK